MGSPDKRIAKGGDEVGRDPIRRYRLVQRGVNSSAIVSPLGRLSTAHPKRASSLRRAMEFVPSPLERRPLS